MKTTFTFITQFIRAARIVASRRLGFQMRRVSCFMLGLREFRSDFGMTYHNNPDHPLSVSYDTGREWAHRLTFRVWDADMNA